MSVTCTGDGEVTFRKLSGLMPLNIGTSRTNEVIPGHKMDPDHYQVGTENTIEIHRCGASLVCGAR